MLTGREKEQKLLKNNYISDSSSFIAVYGRIRIGKTYLIRTTLGGKFTFQHAGTYNGKYKEQLYSFTSSLKDAGLSVSKLPHNWFEAFNLLKDLIRESKDKKKVIFLDELAWMDTPKSDLIRALENFYNGWAEARHDVMLIICSSVTSWIVNKIIHNKGGLYNRLTDQIFLSPFTLRECEEYCKEKGLSLNRKQIIQTYMAIGGIPFYWNYFQKGSSVPQFIDHCFFENNAPLADEYKYLFSTLFRYPEEYIKIIEVLSAKKTGLTRQSILKETGIADSGAFSGKLEDLVNCGFIRGFLSYGKKQKDIVYQLIDPFTIFYLSFCKKKNNDEHFWSNQIDTPSVNTWEGLAFERICLLHSNCIKKSLGISGVSTSIYPWFCQRDIDNGINGSQIDMVIERKDDIINIVEVKFNSAPFVISQKYMDDINRKKEDFVNCTKTKSSIHITFVTLNGLEENSYSKEVQSEISSDELFAD